MLNPMDFSLNGIQILIATMAKFAIDAMMYRISSHALYQSSVQSIEVIRIDEVTGESGQEIEVIGWVVCPFTNGHQTHCIFRIKRTLPERGMFSGWTAVSAFLQYEYQRKDSALRINFKNMTTSHGVLTEIETVKGEEPSAAWATKPVR